MYFVKSDDNNSPIIFIPVIIQYKGLMINKIGKNEIEGRRQL